jgi:hypothetical protein
MTGAMTGVMNEAPNAVTIGLSAAIVAVEGEQPAVLVVSHGTEGDSLPFGPFDPVQHRTLESGLREWVDEQTQFDLGYTEQLYTFGDLGRHRSAPGQGPERDTVKQVPLGREIARQDKNPEQHYDSKKRNIALDTRVVSVGYLALTRQVGEAPGTQWRGWYHYFPWEDWREGRPPMIDETILPALNRFARRATTPTMVRQRQERINICFGEGWDEERVLERYELLYEAGLVLEHRRDGGKEGGRAQLGTAMLFDHRRILATAIARLRGKLKYRPVVFELMAPTFTLLELQRAVEALAGLRLHKQNFRRLVNGQGLVEGTGKQSAPARGRPAELFRFRREVLRERPAPGMRTGGRAGTRRARPG